MNNPFYVVLILILFGFSSCNNNPEFNFEKDNTFPVVKNLSEFKETSFLTTLESSFDSENNGVYAVSLLLAWNEIRNEIGEPFQNFTSEELELIDDSKSFKKVLADNEYSSSVEIENSAIRAKAYFKKSLPFEEPLEIDDEPLIFLEREVTSFGFYGPNNISRIIYFNSDDDFAIKLYPKDNEHEIILLKTDFKNKLVLIEEIQRLLKLQSEFKEKRNDRNDWKYYYNNDDQVRIPIIEFNIENNYSKIEGSQFSAGSRKFNVDLAYQRTAFILNEKGAEVESSASMTVTEEMIEEDLPKPKNLFFDKPYLILLKRKDSKNPYFAMFVGNSELMIKK